jgi:hypothetical protein
VTVEIFYIAGCRSHPAAVKLVRQVLASTGVTARIREVLIVDQAMARRFEFPGSPTIRINGRDVAGGASVPAVFSLSCRLYPGRLGLPASGLVHRAVLAAQNLEKKSRHRSRKLRSHSR